MALISAQQPQTFDEIRMQLDQWGRWVESAIGSHLVNSSFEDNFNVYYWRHRNDEVDFVISDGKKVIGIEVKSGRSQKFVGINAFQKAFNPDKVLLIGNSGIPWQEFLTINPKELF